MQAYDIASHMPVRALRDLLDGLPTAYEPRDQQIGFLMSSAEENGVVVQEPGDAFILWDELAKQSGYSGGFEECLMLNRGYEATCFLPKEMRSHRVIPPDDPLHDAFPELDIHPSMDRDTIVWRAMRFLTFYRSAERMFRDGGANDVHCGCSARLVAQLMITKGFEAVRFGVHRSAFEEGPPANERYGRVVEKISRTLGVGVAFARNIGTALSSAVLYSDLRRETMWTLNNEQFERAMVLASEIGDEGWELFQRNLGSGHVITGVSIGGAYYLIDIDAQQFGEEYDQLFFFPAEEALRHGVIFDGDMADIFESGTSSTEISLEDAYKQLVIREYMNMNYPDLLKKLRSRNSLGRRPQL